MSDFFLPLIFCKAKTIYESWFIDSNGIYLECASFQNKYFGNDSCRDVCMSSHWIIHEESVIGKRTV